MGPFFRTIFILLLIVSVSGLPIAATARRAHAEETIAEGAREVGKGAKKTGIATGKAAKKSGIAVGKAAKKSGIAVGKAAKKAGIATGEAAKEAGKEIKDAVKKK